MNKFMPIIPTNSGEMDESLKETTRAPSRRNK